MGIIVFPGSNCDRDVHRALEREGADAHYIWHEDTIPDTDALVLPGGFSYGDRLRAGIIASRSPAIKSVKDMAHNGMPVLGICNGFQILTEADLLPGALIHNDKTGFMCQWTDIIYDGMRTPFTKYVEPGGIVHIPVANGQGRYYADHATIHDMEQRGQIIFRYTSGLNGSIHDIAGVCNHAGNILGMMPHPERAAEIHQNDAAASIFKSLVNSK